MKTIHRVLHCPFSLEEDGLAAVIRDGVHILCSGDFARVKEQFDRLTQPYKDQNKASFEEKPYTELEKRLNKIFEQRELFWAESYKRTRGCGGR